MDKPCILLIDDDIHLRRMLSDVLRVNGYRTITACNGAEGLALLNRIQVTTWIPDCVLMDIKMPGTDGVKALSMIKTLSPNLPVVLMSAYATDEQIEEAKRQGAYAVLTKPVDLQLVLSFVSLVKKRKAL